MYSFGSNQAQYGMGSSGMFVRPEDTALYAYNYELYGAPEIGATVGNFDFIPVYQWNTEQKAGGFASPVAKKQPVAEKKVQPFTPQTSAIATGNEVSARSIEKQGSAAYSPQSLTITRPRDLGLVIFD